MFLIFSLPCHEYVITEYGTILSITTIQFEFDIAVPNNIVEMTLVSYIKFFKITCWVHDLLTIAYCMGCFNSIVLHQL